MFMLKISGNFKEHLMHELGIISRFGFVGIFSTTIHLLTVYLILFFTKQSPYIANTIAFMLGFAVSFVGNYYWTFKVSGNLRQSIQRFVIISFSAFCLSTLILTAMLAKQWFTPAVSGALAALIIPVLNFIGSRLWAFEVKSLSHTSKSKPNKSI